MSLKFTKMEGAGNDFLVIDSRSQTVALTTSQIVQLGDRRKGVGFDQLLMIGAPESAEHHAAYQIFNADGSEVQQCGNGARALVAYIATELSPHANILLESPSGLIVGKQDDKDLVSVNMGTPDFSPVALPFLAPAQALEYVLDIRGQSIEFGAVSMGNPHVVIPVDDVDTAEVDSIGREFQSHASFPEAVNVGFMQVINRHEIRLRVFERGVGETLACGTGACAAAAVGQILGLLDQNVKIVARGGDLLVTWPGDGQNTWLSGPCKQVFEGQLDL